VIGYAWLQERTCSNFAFFLMRRYEYHEIALLKANVLIIFKVHELIMNAFN